MTKEFRILLIGGLVLIPTAPTAVLVQSSQSERIHYRADRHEAWQDFRVERREDRQEQRE